MQMVETRSVSFSIVLHATALLIAAFGLPALLPKKPDPVPLVMTVELLPMSEVSNVKPSKEPIQKEEKAPTPKPAVKPLPPAAAEKPKEVTPPPPKPVEKEKFDPQPDGLKKEPKKVEEKPKEEAKKPDEDFKALLNKLQQETKAQQEKEAKDKATKVENKTTSEAPYDESLPMSISEKDMIRSQFIPCWNMPAGAKDASTLAARVKMKMQPDGTVLEAKLAPDQMGRYNSDPVFRAAADSAVRAAYKCSPIKNLPADKYGSWKEMELNFDPRDL